MQPTVPVCIVSCFYTPIPIYPYIIVDRATHLQPQYSWENIIVKTPTYPFYIGYTIKYNKIISLLPIFKLSIFIKMHGFA